MIQTEDVQVYLENLIMNNYSGDA